MFSYGSVYIDVGKINLAHEFVLNEKIKCEYSNGRKYFGLIYCIEGKAEYRFFNGKMCHLQKGEVLLLSPEASYSIVTEKEFRHYTVNFEIHNESSDVSFLTDCFCLFHAEIGQLIHHIFKKLITVWMSRKPCFEMQTKASLYELIALLISGGIEAESNKSLYSRMQPAKEYIEQNFNKEITLDFLAGHVNMSTAHFRREWLKLYGESAMQYRDKIRLSYAKQYLMSGYYTVTEVSEKCGFCDANYFIRFFKKHTGTSPGNFMKLL